MLSPELPFTVHLAMFQHVYAALDEETGGPAPCWFPSAAEVVLEVSKGVEELGMSKEASKMSFLGAIQTPFSWRASGLLPLKAPGKMFWREPWRERVILCKETSWGGSR